MSEARNAAVIPFVFDHQKDDGDRMVEKNPAERMVLAEAVRMAEAIVFASAEPVGDKQLAARLPEGINQAAVMAELQALYARRGVNLVRIGDGWAFRTAGDLAFLMSRDAVQQKKLSRAALEVLSIIAYHQPVTRAEIEDIRGVETSRERSTCCWRPNGYGCADVARRLAGRSPTAPPIAFSIISSSRRSATCRALKS